jgi:purine-binding chemotaxis protein CheW
MGIVADAVNQVIELSAQDIEEPPAFGTQVRLDYLSGMGKLGQKFALILNLDRVLSATELLTVASVDSAAAEPRPEAELISESQPEAV